MKFERLKSIFQRKKHQNVIFSVKLHGAIREQNITTTKKNCTAFASGT